MATPAKQLDPVPAIRIGVELPPEADAIFLPTDRYGTPGELNSEILRQLGSRNELPGEKELAKGYALIPNARGLLVFVVTADSRPAEETLAEHLRWALEDRQVAREKSLWVPLLGTGVAKLKPETSFRIILDQLKLHKPILRHDARAVISLPTSVTKAQREAMEKTANRVSIAIGERTPKPFARPKAETVTATASAPPPPDPRGVIDLYQVQRSAAVSALFELASLFGDHPKATHQALSTSLLLFALAESDTPAASEMLRVDPAAALFRAALRERAGEFYARAWHDYFGSDDQPAGPADSAPLLRPSKNVEQLLQRAQQLAGGKPSSIVEIDHIVTALLEQQPARMHGQLTAMQLSAEDLLAAYRDARLGRVATRFQNDVANSEDQLDYARYASAIHAFLTDRDTAAPLSISVQAPWGGGKSTLMHLVREALDPETIRGKYKRLSLAKIHKLPRLLLGKVEDLLDARKEIEVAPDEAAARSSRRWTIWFNAWKYETTEQLWAGLVDAIVSQVSQRLSPYEREKFLLKLQLSRIDDGIVRKRIHDRIANLWWRKAKSWAIAAGSVMLSLFGLAAAQPALPPALQSAIGLWTGSGIINLAIVQVILTIGFLISFAASSFKTKREPAAFSLADIIKVPDYDKGVGELHHVHADLKRVLELVPHKSEDGEPAPLVIFIDDLDRCSPGKVASVVEGVSMLLATDEYRCMFVIGMDPQMIAAALEKAHEDVRAKLPRYERTVPLGWRFMDKFVQLPFTLPPSDPGAFKSYVDWLAGAQVPDFPDLPAPHVPPAEDASDTVPDNDPGIAPEASPLAAFAPTWIRAFRAGFWTVLRSTIAQLPNPPGGQVLVAAVDAVRDAVRPPVSEPEPAPPSETEAFTESRNVGAIIRRIADYSVGNPREMKRMVNLARFYLFLRDARQRKDPAWQPPDPDQYARWIALTLRWPDMLRWLQWGADEAHWPLEERDAVLVARRLQTLERHAAKAGNPAAWHQALNADLSLSAKAEPDEHDWSCDARLFDFFREESKLTQDKRLSHAVIRDFW